MCAARICIGTSNYNYYFAPHYFIHAISDGFPAQRYDDHKSRMETIRCTRVFVARIKTVCRFN